MKSYLKIIPLAFLTFILLCSGITGRNNIRFQRNSYSTEEKDTTDLSRSVRIDSFLLPIIPPSAGVQFYKDNIIFLSMAKNERKMSPDHISFGAVEAYYADVEDSVTGRHLIFSPRSPFSYPCEGMTFSHDFSTIYFSKINSEDRKVKIYTTRIVLNAENQPEMSNDPVMLDFCTGNSNYSHPALSSDGNTLIFASDRKGSAGGMDLFVTHQVNGKWSEPENMGKEINTAGNEYSPFLDSGNNLYFSSDKLPGHGGYDIFTCKFNGTGWDKPSNLGYINSGSDDIAFTMNKNDAKTAFFSRKSNGHIQLFKVSLQMKSGEQNLIAVFNAKPEIKPEENKIAKTEPLVEPVKKEPEVSTVKKKQETKKEITAVAAISTATAGKSAPASSVTIKPTLPLPDDQKDVVIYRVQILASQKPVKEKDIIINGEHYTLYEYYYLSAYRYSVGEFRTLQPAIDLQKICRQSGYAQAFAAAFKNNTRSVDLKSFR